MSTPESNAIKQNILTMVASVYQRTGGTGAYNNAVRTGLACRLDTLNIQPNATSSERAALASIRTFMWDVDVDLPEQGTQIEITSPAYYAGQRWNVQAGTIRPSILPGATEPIAIEIDVRKAN